MRYSSEKLRAAPAFEPKTIRDDVSAWLGRLEAGLPSGRFRYCEKGSLVPTHGDRAYMPTIFAVKIAWQIGLWSLWPEEKREAICAWLKRAQNSDGYVRDSWLQSSTKLSLRDWLKIALFREQYSKLKNYYDDWNERNLRAETRQSISTLLMVGDKPTYAPPMEVCGYQDTINFLQKLDWSEPWGAGSHLSHLAMLTSVSRMIPDNQIDSDGIAKAIMDFLSDIYHEQEGVWYRGNSVANPMKINGAMKVFSGLQWLEHPFVHHDRLIDLILSEPFYSDGCHFTNGLFVLHQIIKIQGRGYRQEEIEDRARLASRCLMLHKKDGAGFSFFEDRSQTEYYTAKVSRGFNEADVHGTVMFTWACAIIIDILKDDFPEEYDKWRAQIP